MPSYDKVLAYHNNGLSGKLGCRTVSLLLEYLLAEFRDFSPLLTALASWVNAKIGVRIRIKSIPEDPSQHSESIKRLLLTGKATLAEDQSIFDFLLNCDLKD